MEIIRKAFSGIDNFIDGVRKNVPNCFIADFVPLRGKALKAIPRPHTAKSYVQTHFLQNETLSWFLFFDQVI